MFLKKGAGSRGGGPQRGRGGTRGPSFLKTKESVPFYKYEVTLIFQYKVISK